MVLFFQIFSLQRRRFLQTHTYKKILKIKERLTNWTTLRLFSSKQALLKLYDACYLFQCNLWEWRGKRGIDETRLAMNWSFLRLGDGYMGCIRLGTQKMKGLVEYTKKSYQSRRKAWIIYHQKKWTKYTNGYFIEIRRHIWARNI